MKGVFDVKKIAYILKLALLYLIGYMIYTTIIFLVEVLFLWRLSGGVFHITSIWMRCIRGNFLSYSIVFVAILLLNVLYNYVSVIHLNQKLEKMRKG